MAAEHLFAPGGTPYLLLPRFGLPRAAADVLCAILFRGRGKPVVEASDEALSQALEYLNKPHSRRYVQKGLKILQDLKHIARIRVEKGGRWGPRIVRQIRVLLKFAQSARIAKSDNALGAKNFAPPLARSGAVPTSRSALPLKELQEESNSAAVVCEAPGGAPPPTAGGAEAPGPAEAPEEVEAKTAGALAQLRALLRRKDPAPPAEARPAPAWASAPSKPARAPDLTDERLQAMAREGDRAAAAELEERRAARLGRTPGEVEGGAPPAPPDGPPAAAPPEGPLGAS